MIRYISLFAGVGGMDLGFDAAGWECVAQVEWDKHCQATLARHWPDVPRWGDIATVTGSELPAADVVAFGSPCQDLSVAGKRAGLDGGRSGLFYEAIRIIKEMRNAQLGPTIAIWENVVGAFSSNGGRDFAAVLDAMAEIGAVDICYRVLDAQHFGVPQRRRRIFLVADFVGGRAAAVLPEPAGVRWHPHPRLAPWTHTAAGVAGGVGVGGERSVTTALTTKCGDTQDDQQIGQLVPTTDHRTWDMSIRGRDGGAQLELTEELAAALRAGDGGSSRSRAIFHTHTHTPQLSPAPESAPVELTTTKPKQGTSYSSGTFTTVDIATSLDTRAKDGPMRNQASVMVVADE